jgi:ABC-type uncharacterized transport system substrate-binding protein
LHALEAFFLTVLLEFFCESPMVVYFAQKSIGVFMTAEHEYLEKIIEIGGTERMVVSLMVWSAFDWP